MDKGNQKQRVTRSRPSWRLVWEFLLVATVLPLFIHAVPTATQLIA